MSAVLPETRSSRNELATTSAPAGLGYSSFHRVSSEAAATRAAASARRVSVPTPSGWAWCRALLDFVRRPPAFGADDERRGRRRDVTEAGYRRSRTRRRARFDEDELRRRQVRERRAGRRTRPAARRPGRRRGRTAWPTRRRSRCQRSTRRAARERRQRHLGRAVTIGCTAAKPSITASRITPSILSPFSTACASVSAMGSSARAAARDHETDRDARLARRSPRSPRTRRRCR